MPHAEYSANYARRRVLFNWEFAWIVRLALTQICEALARQRSWQFALLTLIANEHRRCFKFNPFAVNTRPYTHSTEQKANKFDRTPNQQITKHPRLIRNQHIFQCGADEDSPFPGYRPQIRLIQDCAGKIRTGEVRKPKIAPG